MSRFDINFGRNDDVDMAIGDDLKTVTIISTVKGAYDQPSVSTEREITATIYRQNRIGRQTSNDSLSTGTIYNDVMLCNEQIKLSDKVRHEQNNFKVISIEPLNNGQYRVFLDMIQVTSSYASRV